MRNADVYLLKELEVLSFKPYEPLIPKLRNRFDEMRSIEQEYSGRVGNKLTKRQAVAFGLLARTFQLGISALSNQLYQNHAGWKCSYRALMETFFVIDWISEDEQRFEAYFEDSAPGIGRIKTWSCNRHNGLAKKYSDASDVVHVGDRSLHLPWRLSPSETDQIPFTAVEMSISGPKLESMMIELVELFDLSVPRLISLLLENFEKTTSGETLWDGRQTKAKFGCLGFAPRDE